MRDRRLHDDPIHYRIAYSRAAQHLHLGTVTDEEEAQPIDLGERVEEAVRNVLLQLPQRSPHQGNDPSAVGPKANAAEAARMALRLIEDAEEELTKLGRRWVGRKPPWYARRPRRLRRRNRAPYRRLAAFLDRVLEPATIVLCFSAEVQRRHSDALSHELLRYLHSPPQKALRRKGRLAPLSQDGQLLDDDVGGEAGSRDPSKESRDWLNSYIAQLATVDRPRPQGLKRPLAWLGVTCWRRPAPTDPRVRYNLACLFARLAAVSSEDSHYLRLAATQLRLCLEQTSGTRRQAFADWALRDRGLYTLRTKMPDDFTKIVELGQ